jgi:hypothetical protein
VKTATAAITSRFRVLIVRLLRAGSRGWAVVATHPPDRSHSGPPDGCQEAGSGPEASPPSDPDVFSLHQP